ncbi:serpin B13 isoform X1 [Leopardus geoffroyi]|uniref:serpin B13 isoform X1 n=2 Tax=Leopardus geoffroyi TaxID=46844 RepID=UPI001E263754|nr:serpin B13 isoform X1 [Leopardus geoffroyi]
MPREMRTETPDDARLIRVSCPEKAKERDLAGIFMDSLAAAYTRFGFNLFQKLNKTKDGNIFFSPVGISAAIGMLVFGTQGATPAQLRKMLSSEKEAGNSRIKAEEKKIEKTEEIHHQFQEFLSEIGKSTNGYELRIANRLFGEKTYLFLQKYLDYVEKYYHASLEPVDFVNAADESRKKINSWVESQTKEKIKDLFPDGSLDSFTKLALVNTVYFKGQWDREFKKENTKEEEFWLNKSASKCVPMMTQTRAYSFTFLEDLQAKILGIPYRNNDLSLCVLLPNDTDGLEKIIDQITPENLVEWTNPGHMEERNVTLHLPRFEVEDGYDLEALEAVLAAMGPADAFSEYRTDSLGLSSHSGLQAKKFLHRAFVAVTEEGTEATAGTGVGFALTLAPGYEHFHCNHPFLFFVRHNESNSILFFGRFSSP